jgi:hypothetical protein
MAKYAVINNSTVTNLVVADTLEDAEFATRLTCVEFSEESSVSIGDTWNGNIFTKPTVEEITND